MIHSENQTTKIQFATLDNKGKIGVGVMGMTLQLQELVSQVNVGESITEGDIKELPKVLLEFSTINSIDVVIKALEVIKKNFMEKYGFAMAC